MEDLNIELRNRVALAVSKGLTMPEIEQKFGLPLSTIREWKRSPEFQDLVTEFVEDARQAAHNKLISASTTAVKELLVYLEPTCLCQDRDELTAIELILDFTLKLDKKASGTQRKLKGISKGTVEDIKRHILGVDVQ